MDYEKKYKEALEIAQKLYQDCPNGKNDRLYHTTDLEKMFPELRESEDEKIRKELIEHIKDQQSSFISAPDCRDKYEEEENDKYNSWLAWLEKQGEQKPTLPKWKYKKDNTTLLKDSLVLNKCGHMAKLSSGAIVSDVWVLDYDELAKLPKEELEEQGEQNPTDNVEPKFKIGDWIVFNGRTLYIEEVVQGYYRTISVGGIPNSYDWDIDNVARLWTIQDAKPGDVLYHKAENGIEYIVMNKGLNEHNNIDSYFRYSSINGFGTDIPSVLSAKCDSITPATKKQRDLLFQKMKEDGYEWDAEKKELKEIEDEEYNGEDYGIDSLWHAKNILEETLGKVDGYQTDDGILEHKCAIAAVNKVYKQKPAEWSEEDEKILKDILVDVKFEGYNNDMLANSYKKINWLKSLRQRIGG